MLLRQIVMISEETDVFWFNQNVEVDLLFQPSPYLKSNVFFFFLNENK